MTCAALLFDLDGTLVHSIEAVDRAWATWAKSRGLNPATVLHQIHGRRAEDSLRLIAPHLDLEAEKVRLETIEANDTEGVVAVPGAIELLESLPRTRWAIVTSGTPPVALARIRAAGLPMPSTLVCGNEVLRGKPSPDPFLLGANRLGYLASECIAFEDAAAGLASARASGAKVVQVGPTQFEDQELWISDFTKIVVVNHSGSLRVTF